MSDHLPECPWTPATLLHNDHLCICDRLHAAERRGKNLTVNWSQAYEDAVEDCISALEFMDKHPHGLIDAAAAIACLRTIIDGVKP